MGPSRLRNPHVGSLRPERVKPGICPVLQEKKRAGELALCYVSIARDWLEEDMVVWGPRI